MEKSVDRPAPLLSTSTPNLCKATLNSRESLCEHLMDVLILTPSSHMYRGCHGLFVPGMGPMPPGTAFAIEWRVDTWKLTLRRTDQRSADRKSWPNCLKFDLDTARWAPMSCIWVRAYLKSVWMLWWARGSS